MASLDPCLRVSSCSRSCSSAVPIHCSPTAASLLSTPSSSACFLSRAVNLASAVAGKGGAGASRRSSFGGRTRSLPFCVRAAIRAVESYDASFQLQPEADATLRKALSSEVFCVQVALQSNKGADVKYEFTGHLFQPVPWSPGTKFGMPVEFEKYLHDKENFTVINVPPNFMFNAKIFKPSRLCAIFQRVRD